MKIFLIDDNVKESEKVLEINENTSCYDILQKTYRDNYKKYLAVKVNNSIKCLVYNKLSDGDRIKFIDIKNKDGSRIYVRTLTLIYIKACEDLFKGIDVTIEHSLNKGLYSEIKNKKNIGYNTVNKIKKRMTEIIDSQTCINENMLTVNEAIQIFEKQGMNDKVELLKYCNSDGVIRTYEIDGYYDMYYGYIAPNANVIDSFDIRLFYPGVTLNYPTKENNFQLPEYIEQKKLSRVFREAEDWGDIMEVGSVGFLNNKIQNNTIDDMIRVNEALHEKKIAYLADEIAKDKNVKIVLIAGPSSSGKTTFAQRLSIQLRVNGKKTYAISLDDYFVNRENTPRGEDGDYDFEAIGALDVELFNEQLIDLMAGEAVKIPVFNFKEGKREYTRPAVKLTDDYVIIAEGIHGLNDVMTNHIPDRNKFKIYISALTQLNLDNHNRISTSDLRLIRRIVRDNTHRGHNASRTMELWDNVVKGTEKYIFPYQENADAIFNSSLVYELSVLKKYAEPLLKTIDEDNEFYSERQRLLKFFSYFKCIEDEKAIPNTSILREFIGGSCFE